MAEIILPPVPPRPTPAIRPTMSPELETPGNKGVKVIMVPGPGTEPGPQPDPGPVEPLAIANGQGANWVGSNVYEVGQTLEARTAAYTGGLAPVTYRYRFQTKAVGSETWVNQAWTNTTNGKTPVFYTATDPGQIKFQSQARDSSDPIVQLNSITGTKTITGETFIETDGISILTDAKWDPNNVYEEGETISCSTAIFEGGIPPYVSCNWRWQAMVNGDVVKTDRVEYGNEIITVSGVVPAGCTEVRMWCNAADDIDGDPDVDSLTKKNAFSTTQAINKPLSISRGAKWDDSNIYEVGQTIEARTAVFAGGKEPVSYKYRFQTKEWVNGAWSDTDWVSGPWMETTNEAKVCQWVGMLEETIRFQSWAEDSSDPVNTVPSYTPNKSICEIGTVNAIVNGVFYDLAAASTITVESLSVNALTIEITGLARVSYNWSVRGNAGVEFSDSVGASTDVTIATAGVVTVQCAIQSEAELKTVDIQFFVV